MPKNKLLYPGVRSPNAAWRKESVPESAQPKSHDPGTSRGVRKRGHGAPCPAPDR